MIRQSKFVVDEKVAGLRRVALSSRVTAHEKNPNIMAAFPTQAHCYESRIEV